MEIELFKRVGKFAENKDTAREIRVKIIRPALKNNEEVILNFEGIESTTQSFIHALISNILREFGINVLNKIKFKNCDETIKRMINIVCEYMQTDY